MSFRFGPGDVAPLDTDQKIAIMESFMIAMVADGRSPAAETAEFDREMAAIEWGMEHDELRHHRRQARARVLALRAPEDAVALIKRATARITGTALREKVFRAMAAIMFADEEMAKTEVALLAGYATLFGISKERYEDITADIIADSNAD